MTTIGSKVEKVWSHGQRLRTLIVDDSSLARETLSHFLEASDEYDLVGTGCDGQEGVELTAMLRPDLVLMDVRMPVLNGWDATGRIKLRPGAPVVVLVSTEDSAAYREAARRSGADGFVAKKDIGTELAPLLHGLFHPAQERPPASREETVA